MASDVPTSTTTSSATSNTAGITSGLQRPALSDVGDLSTLVARSGLQAKLSGVSSPKQASQLLAETQSLAKKVISQLTQTAMSKLSQSGITSVSASTMTSVSSDKPAAITITTPPATTMQSLLDSTSTSAANATINGTNKKEAEKEESSYSSSENSSSESSSSSEEESDGVRKKFSTLTDRARGKNLRKRGRPRKYVPASTPTTKTPSITLSRVLTPKISSNTRSASRGKKRPSKVPERLTMSHESQRVRKRIIVSDNTVSIPSIPSPSLSRKRGRGCGDCPGCLRDDCGKCTYCKDKPKFGGPGRKKQRCALRVCSNFSAAPGVRNSKHSLEQAAAASVAAEATAVEKRKALAKQKAKEAKETATPIPTKEPAVPVSTAAAVSTPSATTAKKSEMMHCIQCDRERKLSMARSEIFCTQRCMMQWVNRHPEPGKKKAENAVTAAKPSSKATSDSPTQEKSKISTRATTQVSPSDEAKKASRELKNLAIDMALPGTTLPHTSEASTSDGGPAPLSPPTQTLAPSPRPLSSAPLITTKRPASTGGRSTPSKKPKETPTEPATGTKRTTSQPSAVKKSKQDATVIATPITTVATSASKCVTFDLTTTSIPVTTVQPISAPPLSRTIQPPSISIVPLDQLSALSATLLGQSRYRGKEHSAIPQGLPTDIRSWTIEQVVKYFQFTADCRDYADLFHEQEVDGTALLLLTHESLVKCLGIKLGRALKIMVHVEDLRKRFDTQ